jgi:UrcA family protein
VAPVSLSRARRAPFARRLRGRKYLIRRAFTKPLKSFGPSSRRFHAPRTAGSHRDPTPQATPVERPGPEPHTEDITMNTLTTTTKAFRSTLIAAALAGALLANAASAAETATATDSDVPTRSVQVGDLNLASDAGRTALVRRLRTAAAAVCGNRDDRDPVRDDAIRSCRKAAIAGAIAKFDNPALVAWYAAQSGHVAADRVASSK